MASPRRVVILGAAGRDFHDFNVVFRDDPDDEVVAFTATQIPDIDGRAYPPALAGPLYPHGIPIVAEAELSALHRARAGRRRRLRLLRRAPRAGHARRLPVPRSRRRLPAPERASTPCCAASVPVIAVTAVRTGAGKSQTTRYLSTMLRDLGQRVVAIRHPMPYGDLAAPGLPALRRLCRPRPARVHDRGARGVRAAHRHRRRRLRRRRLRADPPRGRAGGRRHPLGRRQQRPAVLRARPAHRRSPTRCAPATRRLPPGRGQRADGRRRRHRQVRLGAARGRRRGRRGLGAPRSTRSATVLSAPTAPSPLDDPCRGARSPMSSSWRTGRR